MAEGASAELIAKLKASLANPAHKWRVASVEARDATADPETMLFWDGYVNLISYPLVVNLLADIMAIGGGSGAALGAVLRISGQHPDTDGAKQFFASCNVVTDDQDLCTTLSDMAIAARLEAEATAIEALDQTVTEQA